MSTSLQSDRVEVANGNTRWMHNNGVMGFLKSDGNWDMYANNGGSVWTANYGWLHDYFFNAAGNCGDGWSNCAGNTGNCIYTAYKANQNYQTVSNCGNASQNQLMLRDDGSTITLVRQYAYYNCNCNCDCACTCK